METTPTITVETPKERKCNRVSLPTSAKKKLKMSASPPFHPISSQLILAKDSQENT